MSEHATPGAPYHPTHRYLPFSASTGLLAGLAATATVLAVVVEIALVLGLGEALREEWRHNRRVSYVSLYSLGFAFPPMAAFVAGAWARLRGRDWVRTWLVAAVGAAAAAVLIVLIVLAVVMAAGLLFIFGDSGGPVPIE